MRLGSPLRLVGFTLLLLTALAASASAAGVAISWKNTCWGETGSSTILTWVCNSNTNENIRMTCSFKLDQPVPDFNGIGVYMEGMTEASVVPDWWKLGAPETADCRAGAVTVHADGSVLANSGESVCFDIWTPNGGGSGGLGLYSWDTNRTHMNAAWALADPIALETDKEYFAVQFRVTAAKTVGGCAGCAVPMIWALARLDWTTPTTINTLDRCYENGSQCLQWQALGILPCPSCIPGAARNSTWGQIKSLYR